jgi:hypothetical protein
MARIEIGDARSWAEETKLNIRKLDLGLLQDVETQVMSRLTSAYPVSAPTWVSSSTTPALVKNIISMLYVSWFYNRQYAEDESNTNDYARLLEARANEMIDSLVAGTLTLVEVVVEGGHRSGSSYPNDTSSSFWPTSDDPSLGPARFSMGQVF